MGRNNKRNKAITKMYLKPLQKYCQQLEEQLEALKTDPNTTLGQVITQARELYTQNSRLSVLTAALLEAQGNKVTVAKSAMDKFENHRVLIKWELPAGYEGKPEDSTEFVFMYEAIKNEQPQISVGPAPHTNESGETGELLTPVVTEQGIQGVDADAQNLVLVEGTTEAVEADGSTAADAGCPYCDQEGDHNHSMEEIEELQGDPLPECDVHTRTAKTSE